MNRSIIFDAVRVMRDGKRFTDDEVRQLDAAIDAAMGITPSVRRINKRGLDLIKVSEGLRLKAYKCPADVWTIGFGSTTGVHEGMAITAPEAEALLLKDLDTFERGVAKVGGAMTADQFSALVSFSFNLGLGALGTSTLLKKHLAGDFVGAAAEFGKWVNAGGKKLAGLVTRRAAEAKIYRGQT